VPSNYIQLGQEGSAEINCTQNLIIIIVKQTFPDLLNTRIMTPRHHLYYCHLQVRSVNDSCGNLSIHFDKFPHKKKNHRQLQV
jgi:hypothetical protein